LCYQQDGNSSAAVGEEDSEICLVIMPQTSPLQSKNAAALQKGLWKSIRAEETQFEEKNLSNIRSSLAAGKDSCARQMMSTEICSYFFLPRNLTPFSF